MMVYILLWYIIGFVTTLWAINKDYHNGHAITINDLFLIVTMAVLGPVLIFIYFGNKPILQKRKKEK